MEMENSYNVNFEKVLHPQQKVARFDDMLIKAHAAGFLTRYGELTIYGTGAERGTFSQFAVIRVEGITFYNARENLTWFTNIYSTALRNQGKTKRKRQFHLSQRQEIKPLLSFFGLLNEYNEKWEEVRQHDVTNDLPYEWETKNKIHDWESRSKKETIPFLERELEIMEAITINLLASENAHLLSKQGLNRYDELIQEAFIEGLRGLELTLTDLHMLKQGRSILDQYKETSENLRISA